MPRLGKTIAIAVSVLLLHACSGVTVRVDYDQKQTFDHLHTYAWAPATDAEKQERTRNSLIHDRIRSAIDNYFSNHGYQQVAIGQSDFLVNHALTEKSSSQVSDSRVSVGFGHYSYRSGIGIGFGVPLTTQVEENKVGTLIIDIIDAKQNRLVWRGSGERVVDDDVTPEKRTEIINATVNEILNRFPPNPKSGK